MGQSMTSTLRRPKQTCTYALGLWETSLLLHPPRYRKSRSRHSQLTYDALVQSEKQGILGIEVVEIFTRRVSDLAEMTTLLPRSIPNGSHDRHLLGHKRSLPACDCVPTHSCRVCSGSGPRTTSLCNQCHGARNVSPPSRCWLRLDLSVEDARAHVMCWHRLTKICWHAPSMPPTDP